MSKIVNNQSRTNVAAMKKVISNHIDDAKDKMISSKIIDIKDEILAELIKELIISEYTTPNQKKFLIKTSAISSYPKWVRDRVYRINTYIRMRAKGIPNLPPTEAQTKEFTKKITLQVLYFKEKRSKRPDWMDDPSKLPKKPPQRKIEDE